jgi:hypothetical protein
VSSNFSQQVREGNWQKLAMALCGHLANWPLPAGVGAFQCNWFLIIGVGSSILKITTLSLYFKQSSFSPYGFVKYSINS